MPFTATMVGAKMVMPGMKMDGESVLELLEDEVIRALGLLGVTSFAELDKSYLHAATPTNLPDVFSAFPLLEIEPYRRRVLVASALIGFASLEGRCDQAE